MNILTFGPNGSGKGTQGAIVQKKYDIDHIESGAIFREHIKGGTELGKKAKEYIDRGDLVPDDITIPMVLETLGKSKEKGWLLDVRRLSVPLEVETGRSRQSLPFRRPRQHFTVLFFEHVGGQ